jgi:hypothetical protein
MILLQLYFLEGSARVRGGSPNLLVGTIQPQLVKRIMLMLPRADSMASLRKNCGTYTTWHSQIFGFIGALLSRVHIL